MYDRRSSYLSTSLQAEIYPVAAWVRTPSYGRARYGTPRIALQSAQVAIRQVAEVSAQPQANAAAVNAPLAQVRSAS